MQLAQQLIPILGPPLTAVVHHGNVRQIVKHQPFAMRSDGPVKILVEEEVVLVETTNSLLVVHGATAHVKCGPEERDRKDSIQSRRQEDDPEGRPELLRRSIRVDELYADTGNLWMSIQVVHHRTQRAGEDLDVTIHEQDIVGVGTRSQSLVEGPSQPDIGRVLNEMDRGKSISDSARRVVSRSVVHNDHPV